jgi:hypothetical protein
MIDATSYDLHDAILGSIRLVAALGVAQLFRQRCRGSYSPSRTSSEVLQPSKAVTLGRKAGSPPKTSSWCCKQDTSSEIWKRSPPSGTANRPSSENSRLSSLCERASVYPSCRDRYHAVSMAEVDSWRTEVGSRLSRRSGNPGTIQAQRKSLLE